MPRIIVAYDATPHSDDAAAFGALLAEAGAGSLALAHVYRGGVRHSASGGRTRFLKRRAEEVVSEGLARLDESAHPLTIGATTTATGLRQLVEREQASLLVFGSASGTAPGHTHAGSAARRLLQGASCAVAIVPAGWDEAIAGPIGVTHDDDSGAARRSAEALAGLTGASVAEPGDTTTILVSASAPGAQTGRLEVNASIDQMIQRAQSPVIVVPRGRALEFAGALTNVA